MKLAVVFPGIGYHADKPLLYYSKKLAAQAGWQVVEVAYGAFPDRVKGDRAKMEESFCIAMEGAEKTLAGLDQTGPLLFLSKSVGTIVGAAYAQAHGLKPAQVLYTPLQDTFRFPVQGIAFHGTADSWVEDEQALGQACAAQQVPLYLTPGGNHSLETGDALKDLEALEQVMRRTKAYLDTLA